MLEAGKKALSLISRIGKLPVQADEELKFLLANDEWFSMNQILLPHTFVENWKSIIIELRHLKLMEESLNGMPNGSKRSETVKELIGIGNFIRQLADEAEKVLRKELKLPEVKIKIWEKANST